MAIIKKVGIGAAIAASAALAGGVLYATTGGNTVNVAAGSDLQAAINSAAPGDTLVLEAGATFTGTITLPHKGANAAWITIQSSRLAELPEGVRVTPADAPKMPKIVSPGAGAPAIGTALGANHYRLLGIEVAPATSSAEIYDLIRLGSGDVDQDLPEEEPSYFVIDRSYIHPFPNQPLKRGVAFNARDAEIINSHISGFKKDGQETYAVGSWNSSGNHKIINNYMEGAGINLLYGGSTGGLSAKGLVPQNIEVLRNHFRKPPEWRGTGWDVKNLFELKTGRNVVIEGNVFENNWADAQVGYSILFTPRPGDSGPAAIIENVLFTNNVVKNVGAGVNILGGEPTINPNTLAKDIRIVNNLFENVSKTFGDGVFLKIGEGADGITFDHNTVFHAGNITIAWGLPTKNFVFTNNLLAHNLNGVRGDGTGIGNDTIARYFPGSTWNRNVIVGAGQPEGPLVNPSDNYPAGQYFPHLWDEVRFVDQAAGNYRLSPDSPYKGMGLDGKDIGCDVDAILAAQLPPAASPSPTATASVSPSPTPTPTATPTPTSTPPTAVQSLVIRDAGDKVLSNTIVPLPKKANMQLKPIALDAQGNTVSGVVITCSSQNTAVATVDARTHLVTARNKAGEAGIVCSVMTTDGGRSDSFKVRVQ